MRTRRQAERRQEIEDRKQQRLQTRKKKEETISTKKKAPREGDRGEGQKKTLHKSTTKSYRDSCLKFNKIHTKSCYLITENDY